MKMMMHNMMLTFFFLFFSSSLFFFFLFIFFFKYDLMGFFSWEVLNINSVSIEMIVNFDWMALSFLSVVFFISSMVCLYSMEYMSFKKNSFIYLIFMFVASMMLLILSPNMMSILIGWDGLGLVSYILIIFFQSDKSKNSGMLTLMLNRIGDVFIIISSWMLINLGELNFLFYYDFDSSLVMILIILASMTKSAQIPFSSWLPAAMAAPTPVSSLVHSSTLVTAGIYLMIRFDNFFKKTVFMKFILILGTLTMFLAGLAANFEMDLKKIIALSTLSQLGLMMMTLSLDYILLSFFHLLTHALFKALLFLCSGIILHNLKNNQDIRYMGCMISNLPFTVICFNIANLSLCGFLFLSGFFSKDLIIENYLNNNNNLLIYFLLLFSTMLTVSYTFRLIFYLSFKNMNSFLFLKTKEVKIFSFVLFMMTFMTVVMGMVYSWTMFLFFYEPTMTYSMKFIIPSVIMLGVITSLIFIKKKNYFFSSLIFLSYFKSDLKNISLYMTNKTFYYSNFGFFELFTSQGLYKYMMNMSSKNSKYFLVNFKVLTLLSFFIFSLMTIYL